MALTTQQVENYQRTGYATGVRVADEAEAARFRQAFDELEAKVGRQKCEIGLVDWHFEHRFIWDIATLPEILDGIESLIGPNVMLLATHFFCKYGPEEKKFVAWHQDVTYWGLEPPEAITAWYAVDDSDLGNGCMRVIPGTHTGGIRQHGKSAKEGNLLSINQEVPVTREEEQRAVDLILKAGEISIHHGMLIHGSLPNRSRRRRCGLTLRYITPSVRQVEINSLGKRWTPVLLRGQDRERRFEDRPRPFPMQES
jgi:ectoine hydroxylase-related dioxygenase (phytanoyl-CoA dioxygenase family)